MMSHTLCISGILVLCLTATFCLTSTEIDAGSCHATVTCHGGVAGPQGRPGKRGVPGAKGSQGESGQRGEKGTCECNSPYEDEIRQLLHQQKYPRCVQTAYKFHRLAQTTDYIRVKTPIKQITDVTICSWITPIFSTKGTSSFVSYATEASDNGIVLYFSSAKRLEVYINGANKGVDLAITRKTHLCTVIATAQRWAKVYTNGRLLAKLTYSKSNPIQGGGFFIIGQEQDSLGGGFDKNQAFSGTVENFMVWYRQMQDTEITMLAAEKCACPKDYAIALKPEEIEMQGSVTAIPVADC